MGDSQTSSRLYPDNLIDAGEWIKSNYAIRNIKFVLHVGDIVDTEPVTTEWDNAEALFTAIDSVNVPYMPAPGQHDMLSLANRTYDKFNDYFPTTRFTSKSWWNGGFKTAGSAVNKYLITTIGGVNFLLVTLEYGPTAATMTWLDNLLTTYSQYYAIIVTHSYLSNDGDRVTTGDLYDPHNTYVDTLNGEEMWDDILSKHDNVRAVWSGDWPAYPPQYLESNTDGGKKVAQVLFDYQALETTSCIYMQLVTISPEIGTMRVQTFSPNHSNSAYADDHTYSGMVFD